MTGKIIQIGSGASGRGLKIVFKRTRKLLARGNAARFRAQGLG
jgi:hypothetical protein